MSTLPRKLAVFDVDGTLFRWQLFHELVTELTFADVFPENTYLLIDDAWQRWRGGEMKFGEYESFVIETLSQYLPHIPVATLRAAAKKVVAQSGHKTHYYTRQLLKDLQTAGYYTMTISGSQQELLDEFAPKYHFDEWIGVQYEHDGTNYTGNVERETYNQKAPLLKAWLKKHPEITLKGSIAIGDSDGDIPMLEMVERPIAFNPSEGLFEAAKDHGWEIIIERKNISYTLEASNGQHILAKTVTY